jgi:hypothetical protein
MGALQYNPNTMPLRKQPRSVACGAGCGGLNNFCQPRKLCFLAISLGFAMVTFRLYTDQNMIRSLNTTETPMLRKSVEYLATLADVYGSTESINIDVANPVIEQSDINDPVIEQSDINDDPGKKENLPMESENESGLVEYSHNNNEIDNTIQVDHDTSDKDVDYTIKKVNITMENENGSGLVQHSNIRDEIDNGSKVDHDSSDRDVNMEPINNDENRNANVTTETPKIVQKPRLYLHVGPQKTGSSTIQSALDKMSRSTLKEVDGDNLFYKHINPESGDFDCDIGFYGQFINCTTSDSLKALISESHKAGHNLLLTDENLDGRFVPALRESIDDNDWHVTVIVVYRRIHEWLVSWYNQIEKTTNLDSKGNVLFDQNGMPYREEHKFWPSQGGLHVPGFPAWYKEFTKYWQPSELVRKHRSIEFYDLYKEVFDDVVVYNMHQEGDMLTNFMCEVISVTPTSCDRIKNNYYPLKTVNPSVNLDHDILAVQAYEHGLIKKDMARKDAVAAVTSFVKQTNKAIPRKCDANVTSHIRGWLVESEKIMLHDTWSSGSEEMLGRVFESYLSKGKLCDIDSEAVLKDDDWVHFFRSLGDNVGSEKVSQNSAQDAEQRNGANQETHSFDSKPNSTQVTSPMPRMN